MSILKPRGADPAPILDPDLIPTSCEVCGKVQPHGAMMSMPPLTLAMTGHPAIAAFACDAGMHKCCSLDCLKRAIIACFDEHLAPMHAEALQAAIPDRVPTPAIVEAQAEIARRAHAIVEDQIKSQVTAQAAAAQSQEHAQSAQAEAARQAAETTDRDTRIAAYVQTTAAHTAQLQAIHADVARRQHEIEAMTESHADDPPPAATSGARMTAELTVTRPDEDSAPLAEAQDQPPHEAPEDPAQTESVGEDDKDNQETPAP